MKRNKPYISISGTSRHLEGNRVGAWGAVFLLIIIFSCTAPHHSERRAQLDSLQVVNQADTVFRSDSLQRILVDYFDRHGTPDEKMKAHYLLGRAYADMGEFPKALKHYLHAAEQGDTTKYNANYYLLCRIHSQLSDIFGKKYLPRYSLHHLNLASHYALKDGDSLSYVLCESLKANAYYALEDYDSVMIIKDKSIPLFLSMGKKEMAARCMGSGVSALIHLDSLAKARRYLDFYKKESGYFEKNGFARAGHEGIYYTIGQYYIANHQVDSAEYFFRLLQQKASSANLKLGASEGLLKVFKMRKKTDSIAKYAVLCYHQGDSSYNTTVARNLQQMQSMYDYERNEHLAERFQIEAESYKAHLYRTLSLFLLLSFFVYLIYKRYKKTQKIRFEEMQELKEMYRKDLEELKVKDAELKEYMNQYSGDLEERERRISELRSIIDDLSLRVEESKHKLAEHEKMEASTSLYSSDSYKRFVFISRHPQVKATKEDWIQLELEFEKVIDTARPWLKERHRLKIDDYRLCILVCMGFEPRDIITITGKDFDYVSKRRRYMLKKVFGQIGKPADFDSQIRDKFGL